MAKFLKPLKLAVIVLAVAGLVALQAAQAWGMQRLLPPSKPTAYSSRTISLKPIPLLKPAAVSAVPAPPPAPVAAAKSTAKPAAKSAASVPTSDIAPLSACPNQDQASQASSAILCMTNYARSYHGLGKVATNQILTQAAIAKANDIINCQDFSHTACGRIDDYWVLQYGYVERAFGENIAENFPTPGAVFVGWMNSPGHRANILNGCFKDLGVAAQPSALGLIWTMELGSSSYC